MSETGIQTVKDFRAFIEEFKDETDRAIVVLTAARLDFILFSIFEKYLISNPTKTDEFFENQGPGSSFSNKIILAHRLGLIDADFARSLNLVRRIRNDFAHETDARSLEKGSHKDVVSSLAASYKKIPFYAYFKELYFQKIPASRADYMTVVGMLILRLTYLVNNLDPIDGSEAWSVVTEAMKKPIEETVKTESTKSS